MHTPVSNIREECICYIFMGRKCTKFSDIILDFSVLVFLCCCCLFYLTLAGLRVVCTEPRDLEPIPVDSTVVVHGVGEDSK